MGWRWKLSPLDWLSMKAASFRASATVRVWLGEKAPFPVPCIRLTL